MDDRTYTILNQLKLNHVELISLKKFEDEKLLSVKKKRSFGEYCWTCTPSLLLYIFKKYSNLKLLTYLDADLYYYSSPEPIYKEFGKKSIMLIPHRHSSEYEDLEKVHGKFNVGMLIFRKDREGLACLKYWRKRCIEWCYCRREPKKYGDQFYLNDFPKMFKNVYILQNKGANVAPWNVSSYNIKKIGGQIFIDEVPLIFYHAATLQIYPNYKFKPIVNPLFKVSPAKIKIIYPQYYSELIKVIKWVGMFKPDFNSGINPKPLYKAIRDLVFKTKKLVKTIPLASDIYRFLKKLFLIIK